MRNIQDLVKQKKKKSIFDQYQNLFSVKINPATVSYAYYVCVICGMLTKKISHGCIFVLLIYLFVQEIIL
jgi:hypothetical protein